MSASQNDCDPLPGNDFQATSTASQMPTSATSDEVPDGLSAPRPSSSRTSRPQIAGTMSTPSPGFDLAEVSRSTRSVEEEGQLDLTATDRVFPIRSVVSVDPTPTPLVRYDRQESYFAPSSHVRHASLAASESHIGNSSEEQEPRANAPARNRQTSAEQPSSPRMFDGYIRPGKARPTSIPDSNIDGKATTARQAPQLFSDIDSADTGRSERNGRSTRAFGDHVENSTRAPSLSSAVSIPEDAAGLVTARFKHVVAEGGHAIITGRDGDTLQRCEDEPIQIPGAVQGFGLLIALEEQPEGKLIVRVVSENSKRLIGYTPKQLFELDSFTDIMSEDQADNLLDHLDFIRDEDANVAVNGPDVFTLSVWTSQRKSQKLWCAMHVNERNANLIICEFELEDDPLNPLVPLNSATPEPPEDTLNSQPTEEEYKESTQINSKPLRVLRSARKRKGEAAAMEVFNIMSQVQEQLAAAANLEKFLKILVGVVKELTGFHRVMIYQFDQAWNGRVVTELVDPRATKDLYKGLNFPASDIPKQARDLYKVNKVRMLYDRDQETARLVCRTLQDLETPLDLTFSYLRAMSPIHIKYLGNMAVRSSMSISIDAFDALWGLIACHSYGPRGMRVSFPIRKMCRLVGDSASRNIERLSYASRLHARKLINTVPTQANPSGYIIASSEDLLKLFDADFGLLSIRDETKILGNLEHSQEPLAMLEYLRLRNISNVTTSTDLKQDFPDLRYAPGFRVIAGLLLVPLSAAGRDFIVFFRKGQLKEVKWAGNPYEKFIKEGTEGYLEPRKSFKTWSETVIGKCREWTEEEVETAAVLCLVYGKFIEVWRQKEAALQSSQLTRLLLANSAHEVRTPLNAIINYLEIALEGSLDQETRENLAKSHSASKSLVYVINDLLDLTKTEEGGDLVKDEVFELKSTLTEATDAFKGDTRRKQISFEVLDHLESPLHVVGDQRRIRQVISNVTANAVQNTNKGFIKVEMYVTGRDDSRAEVEISITDSGVGMNSKKLDALFRELEQVQAEPQTPYDGAEASANKAIANVSKAEDGRTLGLGLAVVARVVRNMNGQLRLKSEEGKGSRFVIQLPFNVPDSQVKTDAIEAASPAGSTKLLTQMTARSLASPAEGEITLVQRSGVTRQDSNREKNSAGGIVRRNSTNSVASKKSTTSMKSVLSNISQSSANSGKSEADRLIEAIQEPHRVQGWHKNNPHLSPGRRNVSPDLHESRRPQTETRNAISGLGDDSPVKHQRKGMNDTVAAPYTSEGVPSRPGESPVMDQGTPIRAIRVPDELVTESQSMKGSEAAFSGKIEDTANNKAVANWSAAMLDLSSATHMCVLVAEDDPVNSRIIQKRLEKLAHDVVLTVNGEDCASTYCDRMGVFDIVLMDMQMPIVDGLTSTKMIRSHEKSHPSHVLSTRASLNGRVPIIAVSASLVEKERQTYIDAGFDGWILKPISFSRLSEIMHGIVHTEVRRNNLYRPGRWEHGGWFEAAQKDIFTADTNPSRESPAAWCSPLDPSKGAETADAAFDDLQANDGEREDRQAQ